MWAVQMAIPRRCPQTAAYAEHVATSLAYLYTAGSFNLVTDCNSVVASCNAGKKGACLGYKPMAGL